MGKSRCPYCGKKRIIIELESVFEILAEGLDYITKIQLIFQFKELFISRFISVFVNFN